MANYKEEYERWLSDPAIDEKTKQELNALADDDNEIKERFFKNLEFGTGGLRGILGAGTNRMNIYTVRQATQGLANYILKQGPTAQAMGVVIAHDCRRMSREFCIEAALVLSGNGIKSYIFDSLRPTPVLSFAVRYLKCTAGAVVTASHNPPEYNGYKVYWSDGGQTPYPRDEDIITEVNKVTDFSQIRVANRAEAEASGLFLFAGPEVDDAFIEAVKSQSIHPEIIPDSTLKIVYTPLHGTGNIPVRRALKETGFKNVYVVPEQEFPDPDFSTVSYPNPEDPKAFTLAKKLAEKVGADIIVGTDPDADRVGVIVKDPNGEYVILTGNMTGVILTEYILSQKKALGTLPENAAIISTIVSTDLTENIAKAYGASYLNVLTGFKYIGEKIKEFEASGENEFIFGFEESYGSLAGTHARDKDSVVSALLICEAAAFYKKQGLTLYNALQNIYKKYGYYKETIESITLKGIQGLEDMSRIMAGLRSAPLEEIDGVKVVEARDYKNKTISNLRDKSVYPTTLPESDVLYYVLEDGAWFCVRPSGTEPKIKIYFGVKADSEGSAKERLSALTKSVTALIQQ
ncbi:MAG: phospho-sugar mutase [Clostridiales bacterium]|jgi:phosphoglucomutase|nr:phospho-sugar mutase [Clostridiales bacterium]